MRPVSRHARAKVNLTLHVTGRRADGYHLLDSLVVFPDIVDVVSIRPAADLTVQVTGPFSQGVPTDDRNSLIRAARLLQEVRGAPVGAAIHLEKHLPHAAGIGSGSSDAAAALLALAEFWQVAPLPPEAEEVLTLGADVPVCLCAPHTTRMQGIGELLSTVPPLPSAALVLVNPGVAVPTPDVFAGLATPDNPAMTPPPAAPDFDAFTEWLRAQRNDLAAPAAEVAPIISTVLDRLHALPMVAAAGLSGSGATCWGLTRTLADARHAARALQVSEMSWWVAPAELG